MNFVPAWIIEEQERERERLRRQSEGIGIQLPLPLYEYPSGSDMLPEQDKDSHSRVIIIQL